MLHKWIKWKGTFEKAINCSSYTLQLIAFSDLLFDLIGFWNSPFPLIVFSLEGSNWTLFHPKHFKNRLVFVGVIQLNSICFLIVSQSCLVLIAENQLRFLCLNFQNKILLSFLFTTFYYTFTSLSKMKYYNLVSVRFEISRSRRNMSAIYIYGLLERYCVLRGDNWSDNDTV